HPMTPATPAPMPAAVAAAPQSTPTTGAVRLLLRVEGLGMLLLALALYRQWGAGGGWFAALFLVPDLSLLAYLAGRRAGAVAYNAVHSYVGPFALGLAGLQLGDGMLQSVALIWCAHIGFDRMLGYGLKYADGFSHTHLGPLGRPLPP